MSSYLIKKELVGMEEKKVKNPEPSPPLCSSEMPMPLFVLHNENRMLAFYRKLGKQSMKNDNLP